jgi:hypothetical protein
MYIQPSLLVYFILLLGGQPTQVQTQAFVVRAPTPEMAVALTYTAEGTARLLSEMWVGKPFKPKYRTLIIFKEDDNPDAWNGCTRSIHELKLTQIKLTGDEGFALKIVSHEVAHALLDQLLGSRRPIAISEGFALDAEGIKPARLPDGLRPISLRLLLSFVDEYPEPEVISGSEFYLESWSFVRFLVSNYGRRQTMDFFEVGVSSNWEDASELVLGFPLDRIDELWIKWEIERSYTEWRSMIEEIFPW